MKLEVALILSAVLQFAAFFITISLVPKTKFNVAWISISIGFLLMAVRRLFEAYAFYFQNDISGLSELSSWIAVTISALMLLASIYIRKIFQVLNRIQKLRKENEARLLSAVISTEERERKNFAKELHDGLGPVLSSAKMTLSAFERSDAELQAVMLKKTENIVDHAIATTKEISNRLTPHILERYGLIKAIDSFIQNISDNTSMKIDLSSSIKKKRYVLAVEVIIFRICCELINNTLKYASAEHIKILIYENENTLVLKYDDDGIGFDIDRCRHKGMGLMNIESRVKSLCGTAMFRSKHKKGFYASIVLPL